MHPLRCGVNPANGDGDAFLEWGSWVGGRIALEVEGVGRKKPPSVEGGWELAVYVG